MKPGKGGLAILIGKMKPGSHDEPDGDETSNDEGLEVAMEELIAAMEEKDIPAAVEAFRSLFDQLEIAPHAEAEHEDLD